MFPSRRAFTLLELMIVLVILVGVMSVAWPRITGQIQLVAPREAALQVKSDLAEAREQAVISGEPWAFRIERGSAKYEIGPVSEFREREKSLVATTAANSVGVGSLDGVTLESEASQPVSPPSTSVVGALNVAPTTTIEELELPIGMVFDDGWAHSTQDVNQIKVDPNLLASQTQLVLPATPVVAPNIWKYVVIFQPDGRATEAEMRLKDQATEAKILLRIRGLTGGVTIGGVERKQPLTDPALDPTLDPTMDPNADAIPGINPVPNSPTANATTPASQGTLPTLETR